MTGPENRCHRGWPETRPESRAFNCRDDKVSVLTSILLGADYTPWYLALLFSILGAEAVWTWQKSMFKRSVITCTGLSVCFPIPALWASANCLYKQATALASIQILHLFFFFFVWSEEYQAALKIQQNLMQSALDEIETYCEFNRWLNEIHIFCRTWNEKSVKEFRGAVAFTIEVRNIHLFLLVFFAWSKYYFCTYYFQRLYSFLCPL